MTEVYPPFPYDFTCDLPQACRDGHVAIYSLCQPDGELRYIGQAVNPPTRAIEHHYPRLLKPKNHKNDWIRGLLAAGQRATLRVLLWVPSPQANAAEVAYIAKAKERGFRLTNGTIGGHGATGHVKSAETRRKLSLANTGKTLSGEHRKKLADAHNRWVQTGVLSVETRAKLSAASKKRWAREGARERTFTPAFRARAAEVRIASALLHPISEETRAKLSAASKAHATPEQMTQKCRDAAIAANTGRRLSSEHRAALSKARRGNKNARRRAPKPVPGQEPLPF